MTDFSLNETTSRAKLSARGAGYSWGMAEEVARSVFWLAGRELPGPAMLLSLLNSYSIHEPTQVSEPAKNFNLCRDSVKLSIPSIRGEQLICNNEWLCPIASGCALTDNYHDISANKRIRVSNVKSPVLLVPFVAEMARANNGVLVLDMDDSTIMTNGDVVRFSNPDVAFLDQASSVIVRLASASEVKLTNTDVNKHASRANVDSHVWEGLDTYARRTYAPSTESSRALGAGAGLNDND